MDQTVAAFLDLLLERLETGRFHKLALGKPTAGPWKSLSGRPVTLKEGLRLLLTFKGPRTEESRPVNPAEVREVLTPFLAETFRQADLYAADGSWHLLTSVRGARTLNRQPAVTTKAPVMTHDRPKDLRIGAADPWLAAFGGLSQDKRRQIERLCALMAQHTPWFEDAAEPLRLCDLGAGRGALDFALHHLLADRRRQAPEIVGYEVQAGLAADSERLARRLNCGGLRFEARRIDSLEPQAWDGVLALHACDTATDDALAYAVRCGARFIFAAPCCHQELRSQARAWGGLDPVLQHGILWERQAELLTDGLRALVLESRGYRTRVVEFVGAEHTGKNVLIIAELVRPQDLAQARPEILERLESLRKAWGLPRIYLQALLDLAELSDQPEWRRYGPVATGS